jgi:signal transduction histidine kinase
VERETAALDEGNGLGLYLCRVFAESMGGSITAESKGIEGEGTTFVLRLPAPPADAEQAPAPAAPLQEAAS